MANVTFAVRDRLEPIVDRTAQLRISGSAIAAADDLLSTFWDEDVNWELVYSSLLVPGGRAPMIGDDAYWEQQAGASQRVPKTMLAFCNLETRFRLVQDPSMPTEKLDMMAGEWEQRVRDAVFASGRIARDQRASWRNISVAEAKQILREQALAQRKVAHDHVWYEWKGERQCAKCGTPYVPYEHEHQWFEWNGKRECRICGMEDRTAGA